MKEWTEYAEELPGGAPAWNGSSYERLVRDGRHVKYAFWPIRAHSGEGDDYVAIVFADELDSWYLALNRNSGTQLTTLGPFPDAASMVLAWKIVGPGAP